MENKAGEKGKTEVNNEGEIKYSNVGKRKVKITRRELSGCSEM